MLNFLAGMALVAIGSPQVAYAQAQQPSFPVAEVSTTSPEGVESVLEAKLGPTSPLIAVAQCESQMRQFDASGGVLRGIKDTDDTGVFQINRRYHLKAAQALGIDIDTLEGNVEYAEILYKANGLADWQASKYCWDKKSDPK